jgi:hypothetical protein
VLDPISVNYFLRLAGLIEKIAYRLSFPHAFSGIQGFRIWTSDKHSGVTVLPIAGTDILCAEIL